MNHKLSDGSQPSLLEYSKEQMNIPESDHYESALLLSAVGDALGWPTEFIRLEKKEKLPFELPIINFVQWKKRVGGKWWGYFDEIQPGEYSDDTQLTLAVARCIADSGAFEPDRFAYIELPLWLHYQRGGGRSVKAAARSLIRGKAEWCNNFYRDGKLDYRKTGANGAAMRNLPISLVNVNNEYRLIKDSLYNALITHGHPNAIIGAILFGISIHYALTSEEDKEDYMLKYLIDSLKRSKLIIEKDRNMEAWINEWDKYSKTPHEKFKSVLQESLEDTFLYLNKIPKYLTKYTGEYYSLIGALDPTTKGSGVTTTCSSIYLFLKYKEFPELALLDAVNIIGSDTDTIASFVGALFGARYGHKAITTSFDAQIQDRDYLLKTARRLHAISLGNVIEKSSQSNPINRKEAYTRILAWEIGLHEMFWDAIDEGGIVVHPTLGRGIITKKCVMNIPKKNYVAKLLHVKFDCGQTCLFHSRVEKNGDVSESLAKDIERVLYKKS